MFSRASGEEGQASQQGKAVLRSGAEEMVLPLFLGSWERAGPVALLPPGLEVHAEHPSVGAELPRDRQAGCFRRRVMLAVHHAHLAGASRGF